MGENYLVCVVSFLLGSLLMVCKYVRAQEHVSGALNSSISFLDSGLTTLGHITAFLNAVVRGRMDCETVCREALTWIQEEGRHRKMMINDLPRPADSVLALARHGRNAHFTMEFLSHCHSVYGTKPVLLLCELYRLARPDNPCSCGEYCCCLLFPNPNPLSLNLLATLFPGSVCQTPDNLYFLPCAICFSEKTCHGSDWAAGLYYHPPPDCLQLGPAADEISSAMACFTQDENLDFLFDDGLACICMPLTPHDSKAHDRWTRSVMRMVQTKDDNDRGTECDVIQSLTDYLTGSDFHQVSGKSFGLPQSIIPRLTEASLILLLSVWFRVDGFSASLISRRAVRDYVSDSMGTAPHVGLWVNEVVSWRAPANGSICQVFTFRKGIKIQYGGCNFCDVYISTPAMWLVIGSMCSLISTVVWCFSATTGKWAGQWSSAYAVPPTTTRAWFCCASIMGCLVLDCIHINEYSIKLTKVLFPTSRKKIAEWRKDVIGLMQKEWMLLILMVVEAVLIVWVISAIVLSNSANLFHVSSLRFLYLSLELLSWAKWICGSYKLKSLVSMLASAAHSNGKWVYASAFLSCATMAAVGGKWH